MILMAFVRNIFHFSSKQYFIDPKKVYKSFVCLRFEFRELFFSSEKQDVEVTL